MKDNVTVTSQQALLGWIIGSKPCRADLLLPLLDHQMNFDQDSIDSSAAAASALRDRGRR